MTIDDPLKHCRLLMVFGSRSARFQEKCAFPHFSHFLALLVDLKQGNNKPRWTFSFRSEKERKSAICHKIRFWPPKTYIILQPNWWFTKCTFCDDFFKKYFREKSLFAFWTRVRRISWFWGVKTDQTRFFKKSALLRSKSKVFKYYVLHRAFGRPFWAIVHFGVYLAQKYHLVVPGGPKA